MIDLTKYKFTVRADFSMIATPLAMPEGGRPEAKECRYSNALCICTSSRPCKWRSEERDCTRPIKYDRRNSASDGYRLGSRSKVKIRSAANAIYLKHVEKRSQLRFVTFTFPELPPHLACLNRQEQDHRLYRLFKQFLNNEIKNYKLSKYMWVNERQKETRDYIHFHCLFLYDTQFISYETANLRFLNLLGRAGFNIYSHGFRSDSYAARRDLIDKKLSEYNYQWFEENKEFTRFHALEVQEDGFTKMVEKSAFFQPFDVSKKKITSIVRLAGYLSKYISKDDEKEKVYCRRWASSRGLFELKTDIFNEFDNQTLRELYTDISEEQKKKGGYNEKELIPREFEITVDNATYKGWYFPPCFRKWALDPSMIEYFRDKFDFYLTT